MTRWLAATALGITLASRAEAISAIPPPLIDDPSLHPVCVALNTSRLVEGITVTIMNDAGTTLGTTSCEAVSCRVEVPATSGVVYCKVTPPTRALIVTLMLVDTNGVVRVSTESHYED